MARYNVMVPINWGTAVNRFRVEIEDSRELSVEVIREIKQVAKDHVISRGQTLAEHGKIEIYRKR